MKGWRSNPVMREVGPAQELAVDILGGDMWNGEQ
jgi:hypothetical protein